MLPELSERSPLLVVPVPADVEAGVEAVEPEQKPCLNPLTSFIRSHARAFRVGADGVSSLAFFQVANNNIAGWRGSYEENLDKLNLVYMVYFMVLMSLSVLYHHSHDEEKKAPLYIAIPWFLFASSILMLCYTMDSVQDNLLAAQAQITNPEGGPNSVGSQSFWLDDFATPAIPALLYVVTQLGKKVHGLLTDRQVIDTKNIQAAIPEALKKTIKITDKVFTFGFESLAVYGSLYQDIAYYSTSYAGIDLLDYEQLYTTLLYGLGVGLGVLTAVLFETNVLTKAISKQNFEKLVIIVGALLSTSVFYTSNIADTRQNGVNPSTMTSMTALPGLLLLSVAVYALYHKARKQLHHPKQNEEVLVDAPELENDEGDREIPVVAARGIQISPRWSFFGNSRVIHGSLQSQKREDIGGHCLSV